MSHMWNMTSNRTQKFFKHNIIQISLYKATYIVCIKSIKARLAHSRRATCGQSCHDSVIKVQATLFGSATRPHQGNLIHAENKLFIQPNTTWCFNNSMSGKIQKIPVKPPRPGKLPGFGTTVGSLQSAFPCCNRYNLKNLRYELNSGWWLVRWRSECDGQSSWSSI